MFRSQLRESWGVFKQVMIIRPLHTLDAAYCVNELE